MLTILKRAAEISKQEGLSRLIYKITERISQVIFSFYYAVYIKFVMRGGSLEESVDFVFSGCRGLIAPLQNRPEITEFMSLVKASQPRSIAEIGTALGGTLFLFSRSVCDDAKIISIDLPGGPYGGGYPIWRIPMYRSFACRRQKLYLLREDSHTDKAAKKVEDILQGGHLDILFIDGDHSYPGVKRDFELYAGLVRKGGMIALHDIMMRLPERDCDVRSFWEEVKRSYRYKEIIDDPDQKERGIGILYVD